MAGHLGREANFSRAESGRKRLRSCTAEILRARYVSLSQRRGPARGPSGGIHGHRHRGALQAALRLQRSAPNGLGCVRASGRAIRHQDRSAPRRHYAGECGQVQVPVKSDRLFLRLAARGQHDRPALFQMDAMDFPEDLPCLVQPRDEAGRADLNLSRGRSG